MDSLSVADLQVDNISPSLSLSFPLVTLIHRPRCTKQCMNCIYMLSRCTLVQYFIIIAIIIK